MKTTCVFIIRSLIALTLLAMPSRCHADIVSDSRLAAGVIDSYVQGLNNVNVFGNDILKYPADVAIDLATEAALTQLALSQKTDAEIQAIAEVPEYAGIISDILSLQSDMQAAAQGDPTKAGSLLKFSQDMWNLFWIIASKSGLQSSGILPSGGTLTAFGAADLVIGYEFFIVGQVLNLELGVVDYGIGILNAGEEANAYAFNLTSASFFSDTERAMFNDYFASIATNSIYRPLLLLFTSSAGIQGFVPKTNYKVFDVTATYGFWPFQSVKTWTIAADAKVVTSNGQKRLQVAMWSYSRADALSDNSADGKAMPQVSLQFLTNGVWATTLLGGTTNIWGLTNDIAHKNVLYGPKCAYTAEIPLAPNSRLPSQVRTVWSFPGAPDTTNLTVFQFADIQVQSPNRTGSNFLTGWTDSNRHVSIPVTLSSALSVTNLQWSLSWLNTTNNPANSVSPAAAQAQFAAFPASLTGGQPVTGSLDLTFPTNYPPGAYSGILQIDALNASPIMLAVSVNVVPGLNDGLVAHYPFNGNANDASGNGLDGVPYSMVSTNDRLGQLDGAYYFDGLASYINVPSFTSVSFGSQITVSFWIWTDLLQDTGGEYYILDNHVFGGTPYYVPDYGFFVFYQTGGPDWPRGLWFRIFGGFDDGHANTIIGEASLPAAQWNFITYTLNGRMTTAYLNGAVYTNNTMPYDFAHLNAPLTIGKGFWRAPSDRLFQGKLDEVRIYNRALSASEVAQLYTLGMPTVGMTRQGGTMVFSWPTNVPAFTLVSATNLGPSAVWTPVSPAPVIVNGQYLVTNALSGPSRFFRLRNALEPFAPPSPSLVWIPPGTFVMGSPTSEALRFSDETQHTVKLTRGFYMGRYAVTQGEYLGLIGSNPSYFPGDLNRPVEEVNWGGATNYCGQLTQQEQAAGRLPAGWVYRLPTESEWEYACRAGTATAFNFGSTIHGGMANFYSYYEYDASMGDIYLPNPSTYLGRTTAVGSYQPNAWGLYEMHGNVYEWCQDWYGSYPTGSVTDPQGPTSGSSRVIRGGCWYHAGRYCRSAFRDTFNPSDGYFHIGFRVVLAPAQP